MLNCPRCFKRYEVDAALAGKKSRCKDCKEVFTIPAPVAAAGATATRAGAAPPRARRLGSELHGHTRRGDNDRVDDEESSRSSRPGRSGAPRSRSWKKNRSSSRLGGRPIPKRVGRSSRREDVDTEVGVTVAGAYGALGILAFIILAIWHAAGEPGSERVSRVFGASLLIMYVLGLLMATWGNIWLLVIAFRDKRRARLVLPARSLLCDLLYLLALARDTRHLCDVRCAECSA